jgi:hypothetical protein
MRRLTPYLLLAILMLGTGLGIGLGLSEAPGSALHWQFFPAVPSGWKAVSYRGVVLDVPRTWVVSGWQLKDACGIGTPTVLLGPEPTGLMHLFCPAYSLGAAEVNIGARRPAGITHATVINGNRVGIYFSATKIVHGTPEPSVDQVDVHIDNIWITMEVGTSPVLLGGAPGRAMQIVSTIHTD